jgi:hypothetical protein
MLAESKKPDNTAVKKVVGQFNGEPSLLPHFRGPALNTKPIAKAAPRATGLEMALETIFQKKVDRYRRGLDRRSHRAQTRFYFSSLDPID